MSASYTVLKTLGRYAPGTVLTVDALAVSAGFDVSRLKDLGVIRDATSGELSSAIALPDPEQSLPSFTTDGTPDGATYAGRAPTGAILTDISTSPPTTYVNTGTIAAPDWQAAGGGSGGVSSLNGATGDVTLGDGTLTSVSGSGSALQVDVTLSGVTSDGAGGLITQGRSISTSSSDGPVATPLLTGTYEPDYRLTHTYTADDVASGDSWYGDALVTFLTWTPTEDGDLLLLPPASDGLTEIAQEMDFSVFAGDVIGTDVPSLDGSGSQGSQLVGAGWATNNGALQRSGYFFAADAGQIYTLAAILYAPSYGDPGPLIGTTVDLTAWVAATESLGGQPILVPQAGATGRASSADSRGTAGALAAHADSGGDATGIAAHADSVGSASDYFCHADSEGTASGGGAHADSGGAASARYAHADSQGDATDDAAHADSEGRASGPGAHANSGGFASGPSSHARRAGVAQAHSSEAEGIGAVATQQGEHAFAHGFFTASGDSQVSRLPLRYTTVDATPSALENWSGSTLPMLPGETWLLEARIVASRHDTPGTAAVYRLSGAFSITGGTIRQIGTTTAEGWADADASTWTAQFGAHDSQVDVVVTGEAGKTIRWLGDLTITRVGV